MLILAVKTLVESADTADGWSLQQPGVSVLVNAQLLFTCMQIKPFIVFMRKA